MCYSVQCHVEMAPNTESYSVYSVLNVLWIPPCALTCYPCLTLSPALCETVTLTCTSGSLNHGPRSVCATVSLPQGVSQSSIWDEIHRDFRCNKPGHSWVNFQFTLCIVEKLPCYSTVITTPQLLLLLHSYYYYSTVITSTHAATATLLMSTVNCSL